MNEHGKIAPAAEAIGSQQEDMEKMSEMRTQLNAINTNINKNGMEFFCFLKLQKEDATRQ